MVKVPEATKQARKQRILSLLRKNANGLTEREIADILHINQRSINNYLRELESEGRLYKDEDTPLWYLDTPGEIVLRNLPLEPEQAGLLYLALRLFVKQADKRNEIAETLLLSLAQILKEDAKLSDDLVIAAEELSQRPVTPGYEDTLRTILRAYLYRRKVQIVYHPYRGEPFETVLSPYLIEPSAFGFAYYVIGHSSAARTVRTHKIERIEAARLLHREEYSIPADFPGIALLRNAYSIYYGEDVVRVTLRFHPQVARRVLETNWRTALKPEPDAEKPGYLRLTFEVADTTDLKPWIRTWGAKCEVLEPRELREEMIGEARRLAELYDWKVGRALHTNDDDPLGLTNTMNDFFK